MARYFFETSYDGTPYHGWQIQKNAHTVQAEINTVLSTLAGHAVETVGSGRTDTGVHALQQIFHCDIAQPFDVADWLYRLNAMLPASIAIRNIVPVVPDAHARFHATARAYTYRLIKHKDPFWNNRAFFFPRKLDEQAMQRAIAVLVGKHDFQSFCRAKADVSHYECHVLHASWEVGADMSALHIRADRFLHGMVRAIVGTLLLVGEGKMTATEMEEILKGRDRRLAGSAAPPEGLYLQGVEYSASVYLTI
jgi:tRNA pseudouridine38-40 synthase